MRKLFTIFAAGSMLAAGAFAQSSEVNDREKAQQERIAKGVKDGQLNATETQKIEHKEAGIKKQIAADRAANGGKLTNQEKHQINKEDNRLSGKIYQDKHNAATDHTGKGEVGQREATQQSRIANGIASGQLKPGEAAKLEGQEKSVNREVATQRALNGGKLTGAEKKADNQQLNKTSGKIYNKKHNDNKGY
jgi:hypothetical protein